MESARRVEGGAQGRRHGLRHRRRGRRHRHGRRPSSPSSHASSKRSRSASSRGRSRSRAAVARQQAEQGIAELAEKVDTLIVIENDRLLQVVEKNTPLVRRIQDGRRHPPPGRAGNHRPDHRSRDRQPRLRRRPHDHARRRLGADGNRRRPGREPRGEAARTAVSSPLLESSIDGATGILLNITGPADLGLFEVNEAAEVVTSAADQNANVIFGAVIDDSASRRGPGHGDRNRLRPAAPPPRAGGRSGAAPDHRRCRRRHRVRPGDALDVPSFLRDE